MKAHAIAICRVEGDVLNTDIPAIIGKVDLEAGHSYDLNLVDELSATIVDRSGKVVEIDRCTPEYRLQGFDWVLQFDGGVSVVFATTN